VSVSGVLYPRWLPLLKIEISSNGQNCSILSQNVPKFELFKHADGHNFERGPPEDHSDKGWLKLARWFLTKDF
jgi:hypothetical protein